MSRCHVCHIGDVYPKDGMMWGQCPDCGAYEIFYEPQDYQMAFHKDTHMIRGLFGGYGSGKTTTAVAEIIDHVLSVPNGCTLITAPTMRQLEKTAMKEFQKQMPAELIIEYNKSKSTMKIYNGHEILFFPSDDDTKIRSLNLSAFYIEEASGINHQIFVELQNRLRNTSALEYKKDVTGKILTDANDEPIVLKSRLIGIVCSNPDVNWIRTDFLLESADIYGYGSENYFVENPNPYMSSHIIASHQNKYLARDFIERNSVNKPEWWVKRYLFGSFDYSEGMVYPDFIKHVVDPFEIPKTWKRLSGADFGLRDPTVMLMAGIDPATGIVYIYNEHYEAGQPVNHHAMIMAEMLRDVPSGYMLFPPIADPSGKQRSKADLRSLYDHYAEYGVFFQAGDNKIESGIAKVFTYFKLGKLKIFSSCVNTVREGVAYRYEVAELNTKKNLGEKPIDKDNHAMDSLRYLIQALPDDPLQLKRTAYGLWDEKKANQFKFPHALREETDDVDMDWYYS